MSSRQLTIIAILCGLLYGTLLIFIPASTFVLAVLAAVVGLLIVRTPFYGLAGFALTATFMPLATVQLGIRITVCEALLGAAWLGTAWQLFTQRLSWQWGRTEKAMATLMIFSVLPFVVGQLSIQAEGNGPVNWVRWLLNLSVLWLVPLLLDDERRREQLINLLLLGNLAMLAVSLGMFARHRNALDMIPLLKHLHYAHPEAMQDIFGGMANRLGTPWVHPNLSGGALTLFTPLALILALVRRGWSRALAIAVALLAAIAIVLTGSRGAILSMAVVLVWMAWRGIPTSRRIIIGAIALSVAMALFYPPLQKRLATMFQSSNASTEVRLDEYRHFPQAMLRYPLGIGFKTDPPVPGSGLLGISNLWLNYIYKIGLAGMLLFCVVLATWWRETRPDGRIQRPTPANAVWLGSLAGLLGALLTGLFDHYYSFTMVLVGLFWLMLGLNLQGARQRPARPAPIIPSRLAADRPTPRPLSGSSS
ncbi:O-antigen ligase family protein [Frateuria aurantia]